MKKCTRQCPLIQQYQTKALPRMIIFEIADDLRFDITVGNA